MAHRVLVVDDDSLIRRALRSALRAGGYEVEEAETGLQALERVVERSPDVVLLDLGLPDVEGVEVCRRLRAWSQVPVIVVSTRGDERAKVAALDSGADDYVTKPFSYPELLARIRVALRRPGESGGPAVLRAGDVEIDLARRVVRRAGEEVRLTPNEHRLLFVLARHPGRVLTHTFLLKEALGDEYGDSVGSLRVYVNALRRKLEPDPAAPRLLLTDPGIGYRLQTED